VLGSAARYEVRTKDRWTKRKLLQILVLVKLVLVETVYYGSRSEGLLHRLKVTRISGCTHWWHSHAAVTHAVFRDVWHLHTLLQISIACISRQGHGLKDIVPLHTSFRRTTDLLSQ
jgi:hypothetical protein